jgi:hypothetical protein
VRVASAAARHAAVDIDITSRADYIHVAVANREGVADARDVLQRIIGAINSSYHRRLLIAVRHLEAIFNVADYGLLDAITRLAGVPGLKIAVVADTDELLLSCRYIETLASERNLAAKAFASEDKALDWLLA